MDSTSRNFWKMIYDRKCAVVVMVSGLVEGGVEASTRYWPSSGTYQYGEYTVDLLGEEPLEGFTIRDLSVIDSQVCDVCTTDVGKETCQFILLLVTDVCVCVCKIIIVRKCGLSLF